MSRVVSPLPGPTPRAQLSRVVLAGCAAVLLGAGPAVAWEMSTQPPRAEARSAWPRPSPWLSAGKQMKAAAGSIARIYLPRDKEAPVEPADPAAAAASPSPSVTAATATAATSAWPTPRVVSGPYKIR